jgi:glycosyltransferase involved in cell wall biosynthesis
MAPYRVNLFNELGKYCELTVCFEQQNELSRNKDWYEKAINHFNSICLKNWDKPISKIKFDILNQVRNNDYDIAIAYEYSTITGVLFIVACRLKNIPYIINCDGAFIESHPIKDFLKKFLIVGAAACFANGKHARDYFLNYGATQEKIYFHNFTSLYEKDIPPSPNELPGKDLLRRELKLTSYSKIVITVGRFIKSKRINVLISAWASMPSDWLLVIVGSGELESEYVNQINTSTLKNILLTGHLGSAALAKWYQASDLFALPTESDVWGLVVNEAMAGGLPIITTDKCIAGLELIVDGYNGYILPVGETQVFADRIYELLSDKEKLSILSTNALKAIQNYTYESVATAHMNAMNKVLGSGPNRNT